MKFKRGVVAAFLGVAVMMGAEARAQGPGASQGKVFTFRIPGEPETLDWNRAHTPVENYLLMNLMEGLVAFDKDLKVVPALAKSWTRSEDGRTYTFKLREGVKWSDGVPLRAADFVYSWKRLLSPVTAASYAYFLFDIEGAEFFNQGKIKDFADVGVKAPDDRTLVVKLARPVAHWIQMPTFWVTFPLRQDIVEKHGESWSKPGRMVTLGPFTLFAYDMDSKVVLKANPTYYGTMGNLTEAVGLIVKDDSTALTLYESGKFDFLTDIATLDIKRLSGRPDLKTFPYLKVGYLGFGVSSYPIADVRVRRAIARAIDKSKIGQVLPGGQSAATSFVPPGMMGYSRSIGLPFDVAKARAELKTTGMDPGRPFKLELVTANWDEATTLAQFIQGELKKNLGLDVTVTPFDHKSFRQQLDTHAFPLFQLTWGADYPDPDNFLSVFLSTSGNNRTTWKNPKFDDRVLEARNILSPASREKAYIEAQRLLIEQDAVIVPLYYKPNIALVRSRVTGLELNPLNYLYLRKIRLLN